MQDNSELNKDYIIRSINRRSNILKWIILLIFVCVIFVNLKLLTSIFDYLPPLSAAVMLFMILALVVTGFYLFRRISYDAIENLIEYSNKIKHDAFYDSLTNLPNRAFFKEHLRIAFERIKSSREYMFAVFLIDIDRFQNINDSLGHSIGDNLLISTGKTLQSCLRPNDFIARLGGDEYAILLDDIKHAGHAKTIADRIYEKSQVPITLGGQEIFTSVSIGIVISHEDYEYPDDIMRDADTAMNRAKALGKARHVVFDTSMHHEVFYLMQLDTDLRKALERKEFFLTYQPIVSIQDGNVIGFETLIRWNNPERGLMLPEEFISIAENTGLIIPIGQWVLHEACRQMRLWHERYSSFLPLKISVNISSKEFTQPDLIKNIEEILLKTGFDARSLSLEITESMIMENPQHVTTLLKQLKALNIQLHIDDFGTGYSSLSYLSRFPIDVLKIDRSFVDKMNSNKEHLEIVRTIVNLAHTLGIDVIAEGVEKSEHLQELKKLNCTYAQGYFFSVPLDVKATEIFMKSHSHWL